MNREKLAVEVEIAIRLLLLSRNTLTPIDDYLYEYLPVGAIAEVRQHYSKIHKLLSDAKRDMGRGP